MKKTTVNLLKRLLENGSVTASSVSSTARSEIQPLLASKALSEKKSGAGSRLVVIDAEAIAGQLERVRPHWAGSRDTPPRAYSVRRYRDSKRASADLPETILLRSCHESCMWTRAEQTLNICALTRVAGIAAIAVETRDQWHTEFPLGMIENKEVFFHCDKLYRQAECGSFIYYAGNVSKRLNAWLAARERAPKILFYADYDPVGLQNYIRLKKSLPIPVEFVVPPNLEELLAKWGKQDLLEDNVGLLPLITKCDDNLVIQVVEAMQKYGCGLEQEILLTC